MANLSIRQIRLAKEISQQEMASKLGVHVNTYASWEKEPLTISIGNAFKIASIFNMPIDDIFFKSEIPQNVEQ